MRTRPLTTRERRLGGVAGLLLLVTLAYAVVIDGYLPARADVTAALDLETARYARLVRLASTASAKPAPTAPAEAATSAAATESDLIGRIYASAEGGVHLRSVEPRYVEDQLELSIAGAGSAQAAGALLVELETLGAQITDVRLTAAQRHPGSVTVTLTCRFEDVRP